MITFKQDDQIRLRGKGHTVHGKINIFDGTSRANRINELDEVRIALCYSCLIKSCLNYVVEGSTIMRKILTLDYVHSTSSAGGRLSM